MLTAYHWCPDLAVDGRICDPGQKFEYLFEQDVVAAPLTPTLSSLSHYSGGGGTTFIKKIMIIVCIMIRINNKNAIINSNRGRTIHLILLFKITMDTCKNFFEM